MKPPRRDNIKMQNEPKLERVQETQNRIGRSKTRMVTPAVKNKNGKTKPRKAWPNPADGRDTNSMSESLAVRPHAATMALALAAGPADGVRWMGRKSGNQRLETVDERTTPTR